MKMSPLSGNASSDDQGWTERSGGYDQNSSSGAPQARTKCEPSRGLKKGLAIVYLKEFVKYRFGETAWEELIAAFPTPERELLKRVKAAGWYDLSFHATLNREFCAHFGGASLVIAQELGRFSAEQDLTAYSWIIRLLKPSTVIRNINMYWRRGNETGRLRAEMVGDAVLAQLSDWGMVEPALCHRFLGYFGRMLEYFGPVSALQHDRCRAFGAPTCDFRLHWRIRPTSINHGWTPTTAGLFHTAFELTQYDCFDDLADGIVELFLSYFSCSHVKLWIRSDENAEPTLVRSAGESPNSSSTCCFVLWTGGRAVGQVELTSPFQWSEEFTKLLESLLPAIATAIERVCSTPLARRRDAVDPASRPVYSNADIGDRLIRAKASWRLTDRETEVLGLLARGNSNKEISAKLRIEEGTLDAHLSRVRSKCGADSSRLLLVIFWSEL
jgi:DNA-binding CsgD family transcriptional regulator